MPSDTIGIVSSLASSEISANMIEIFVAVGGIVAAIAGIVWPMVQVIRKFNSDKDAAIQRNEAEITLYEQLKEQLETNKRELDEALRENRRLWEIIRDLESRLKKIEEIEMNFDNLRQKIEEKDQIISMRDSEINNLKFQLQIKEEKIRDLEIRVAHLETLLDTK